MNEDKIVSVFDLLGNRRYILKGGKPMNERNQLLGELSEKTGLSIGRILEKTAGMQTPADLRFILSAMKNVPKAKDALHAFFTVTYTPKDK